MNSLNNPQNMERLRQLVAEEGLMMRLPHARTAPYPTVVRWQVIAVVAFIAGIFLGSGCGHDSLAPESSHPGADRTHARAVP